MEVYRVGIVSKKSIVVYCDGRQRIIDNACVFEEVENMKTGNIKNVKYLFGEYMSNRLERAWLYPYNWGETDDTNFIYFETCHIIVPIQNSIVKTTKLQYGTLGDGDVVLSNDRQIIIAYKNFAKQCDWIPN